MRKIKEVLRLKFDVGLGLRQIARSCSIVPVRRTPLNDIGGGPSKIEFRMGSASCTKNGAGAGSGTRCIGMMPLV